MTDNYAGVLDAMDQAYDRALTSKREFAFTSLKEFDGLEGYGFSATVTRNGKKVGEVVDEGNGGAPYLRLGPDDQTAFHAEAASFHPADVADWSREENYVTILAFAAQINRKRAVCVAVDKHSLSDGEFIAITGGSKDPADVARYLLGPTSGVAGENPKVWVKTEGRFVPAADLA